VLCGGTALCPAGSGADVPRDAPQAARLKLTTSAPEPCKKVRRETFDLVDVVDIVPIGCLLLLLSRDIGNGAQDTEMGATAAKVAREGGANVRVARMWIGLE